VRTAPSNVVGTDANAFEEAKASQSDSGGPFKFSLCEGETTSDGDVSDSLLERHECELSASALRLSISMMM
jgi:hypothetical protein